MTIRTRLTLWYAAIMFVSLLAMSALTYHEFAPDPVPMTPTAAAEHAGESDETDLKEMLRILFWCGVPPALIALVGGWWLMRRALTPVAALTDAAEKIHEGNLAEKISRTGNGDELDRLTEVFNAMTTRLDGSFQRIREFTLHASHELKTPLTVLHGEIETELGATDTPPVRREKLASQLDEIQRLAKIVDGLTLLTKADAGQVALKLETVALDEIVRDALADTQILAKPANISVILLACEKISVQGDTHRLRQLLLNLADNAVKYNQPGGTVEFSLRREGSEAELQIANTGNGIPPEVLPRVFERFYRGEAAHNSATDGCGLGLSIVQWIANAHHGAVKLTSVPGKTTVVTVKLPIAHPS
ncbi:MAG: ATP-binding protein [Verrucomicrobiota bacterium]